MKTVMRTRNDFASLLCEMGLTGLACEVGTAEGYFSHYLLDRWPGRLWQIDPWRILSVPGFSGHGEATDAAQQDRYERIMRAAKIYNGRCIPLRVTSGEGSLSFREGNLDFCYLDANHSLSEIRQDMALWWPKVKRGGILAGHDYLQGIVDGVDYGVKQAVSEFAANLGLTVNVTQETEFPSWFIVKP